MILKLEKAFNKFWDEKLKSAHIALDQANQIVSSWDGEEPYFGVDDETIIVQWSKDDLGVLLLFTGMDTFSVSIKYPGKNYNSNMEEFKVSEGLSPQIQEAIQLVYK